MARNEGHVHGKLAEFKVAADLVEQGCRVSYTHGEYKYDLVGFIQQFVDQRTTDSMNHGQRVCTVLAGAELGGLA